MREIKFRAWGPLSKYMLEWSDIEQDLHEYIRHHSYKLMQFTGLLDKNGKEIYEGDIVTWHNKYFEYNNPKREFKGQIKYDTAHFAIFTLDGTWDNSDWIGAITEVEINGNIYENPELLEKPT